MPVANDLFDFTPYLSPTRFSAGRGVVLASRLIKAAPEGLPERVREGLHRVRTDAVSLQELATDRFFATNENVRPLDALVDGGYIALREALRALTRLKGRPEAEQAEMLLAKILPNDASFITAGFEEQFFASKITLKRIDDHGLETELHGLLGEAHLAFLRDAHGRFGDALGLGDADEAEEVTGSTRDAIRQLANSIANYGRLLVGWVDPDDEASMQTFRRAVKPLDQYRATVFGGSADGDDEPDPVTDAPPVEDVRPTDPVPPVPVA